MISFQFLITSLLVVLMPGTGVIYTVSSGLFQGRKASIAAAAGCTAGIIPHLCASILGLAAIIHTSAVLFQMLKYAGALYLLYMAWGTWRDRDGLNFRKHDGGRKLFQIARRGFLINILNPKLSIFFLAFLPLFVPHDAVSPAFDMAVLSLIFMLMTFAVFVLYGIFADAVRNRVVNSPAVVRLIQRTFALTFAAFGVKLAMMEQE